MYVSAAAEDYGKNGPPTNVTRISILTGIDRKKIKAIREQSHADLPVVDKNGGPPAHDNHIAATQSTVLGRILLAWFQNPEFSSQGKPQALTVDKQFVTLCKRFATDKTHTSILNELLRIKAIKNLPGRQVLAVNGYYMPERIDPEALARAMDMYHGIG